MQSKLPQAGTRSITLLATIYQPLSVAATIYHPLRLGAVFANTCNRNRIEEWLSCCILCILYAACIYTVEQRGCIQEWSRIRCQITFEDPGFSWSVGFSLKSTMSPTTHMCYPVVFNALELLNCLFAKLPSVPLSILLYSLTSCSLVNHLYERGMHPETSLNK